MQGKFTIIHNILSLFGFFHLFPLCSAEKAPFPPPLKYRRFRRPIGSRDRRFSFPSPVFSQHTDLRWKFFPFRSRVLRFRVLRALAADRMHAAPSHETGRAWRYHAIKRFESV